MAPHDEAGRRLHFAPPIETVHHTGTGATGFQRMEFVVCHQGFGRDRQRGPDGRLTGRFGTDDLILSAV